MDFETLVERVLKREGGYVNNPADRGGKTNHGISQRAFPNVDIERLTREEAKRIYREHFWDPLDADQLPAEVRDLAFDTAVHHGVGRARQWLRETGGDPSALLERRRAALQAQGQQPGQEQFLRGWMNRLSEFSADGTAPAAAVQPVSQVTPVVEAIRNMTDGLTARTVTLPSTLQEDAARQEEEFARDEATGFGEAYKAGLGDPRLNGTWTLLEALSRPDRNPEFSYFDAPEREEWEKRVFNDDELTYLRENATSREGAEWALARIETRREMDREVYGRAGPWASFAGQAAASFHDPVGWVAGLGIGKALQIGRIGSFQLAQAGRRGAAAASAVGEGVVGNVGFEALQDMLGENKTAADYAAAAALGVAFSTIALPGLSRTATAAQEAQFLEQAEAALRQTASDSVRAAADANAAARASGRTAADVEAAQAAELAETIREGSTVRPPGDRVDVTVPDDLAAELRAEDAPTAGRQAAPEAPATPAVTPEAPAAPPDQKASPRVIALPRELIGAKPRYSFGPKQFTLEFESDIDRALYIVAADKPSKRDADYLAFLRENALVELTDAQIRAFGRQVREAIKAQARDADPGSLRIPDQAELAAQAEGIMQGPGAAPPRIRDVWAQSAREGIQSKGTKTMTLREAMTGALESPAARASSQAMITLTELLARIPEKLLDGVTVTLDTTPGARGLFNRDGRSILTPARAGDVNQLALVSDPSGSKNEALTLAHEAVHAATAMIIRAVREGVQGLPPEAVRAVKRLDEIRQDLKTWIETNRPDTPRGNSGAWYAATGGDTPENALDEFVTQAMTDRVTQKYLMEMPGQGYESTSGWDRFKKAVRSLLGFRKPKANDNIDAWTESVQLIETLIDTQGKLPDGIVFGGKLYGPNQTRIDTKFSARMYQHAADWLAQNPINTERLQVLGQQALARGSAFRDLVVSDGLKLAASPNPILRMIAGLVVETTTGAAGRRQTAAIKKEMLHQKIVGNSVVDYHDAYQDWRKRNGGSWLEDIRIGEKKRQFDRAVYEEILHRRYGMQTTDDGAVRAAADSLQRMFQRSLDVQRAAATLGSAYLPTEATGYVPQALDGDRLREADTETMNAIRDHLARHWQAVEGWDRDFTLLLADKYLWRARRRKAGETGVDFVATESTYAAVRDTLEEMKLEDRSLATKVDAAMDRLGAQPQNRRRLDVDLLATLPNGRKLLDYYSTNVEVLARQHANRVAGASALAERNILGQRGVNNLLRAVDDAPPEYAVTPEERAAAERVFAEFLGTPWRGERRSALAANIAGFTRLQRLGGLGFTQLAEMGNMIHHLGFTAALRSAPDLLKMVGEIRKLRRGESVDNKWLSSLETHQGFEFGLANFRMVAALDAPDELLRSYGKGSDIATRLIAAGNYAQNALSFFRGIHSAQHRMMAEMIVKRALEYIEAGATGQRMLDDMGINPEMAAAIRQDLPLAIVRDGQGNPIGFDITKIESVKAAEDFLQAVHRGTSQIIQGTFIGERGAWAHDDVAKLFLQLRTFGLTSMEKQWGRTRTIHTGGALNGYGFAAGVLIAQMALTLPIYLTRVGVYAAGREDHEEFIERATSPASMLQAVMNYTAMSGLAGDAFDMVAATAGGWSDDAKEALGTRSFATGVGGLVPAFGSIDAALRVAQGRADLHTAMKQLPFSNLPFVAPVINLVKGDD